MWILKTLILTLLLVAAHTATVARQEVVEEQMVVPPRQEVDIDPVEEPIVEPEVEPVVVESVGFVEPVVVEPVVEPVPVRPVTVPVSTPVKPVSTTVRPVSVPVRPVAVPVSTPVKPVVVPVASPVRPPGIVNPLVRNSCVYKCLANASEGLMRQSVLKCVADCVSSAVDSIRDWVLNFPVETLLPFDIDDDDEDEDEGSEAAPSKNMYRKTMVPINYAALNKQNALLMGRLMEIRDIMSLPSDFWNVLFYYPFFNRLGLVIPSQNKRPSVTPVGFASEPPPFPGVLTQIVETLRSILERVIKRQQEILQMIVGCSCNGTMDANMTEPLIPGLLPPIRTQNAVPVVTVPVVAVPEVPTKVSPVVEDVMVEEVVPDVVDVVPVEVPVVAVDRVQVENVVESPVMVQSTVTV